VSEDATRSWRIGAAKLSSGPSGLREPRPGGCVADPGGDRQRCAAVTRQRCHSHRPENLTGAVKLMGA